MSLFPLILSVFEKYNQIYLKDQERHGSSMSSLVFFSVLISFLVFNGCLRSGSSDRSYLGKTRKDKKTPEKLWKLVFIPLPTLVITF